MANKVIDPAPIIKKLADRCLVAKGLECRILGELIDLLRAAPAVDAVEVVHGRWEEWWPGISLIMTGEEMLYRCSACDAKYADIEGYKYCPNCGAKMDGDRNG